MSTLNTFNRHVEPPRYEGSFHFYVVEFNDIYSGKHYFRVIDAGVFMNHKERMAHFDADINGTGSDPRYTITAYEIDLEDDEMEAFGLRRHVMYDTYWDRALQGAV
jgi:hypothetical protein